MFKDASDIKSNLILTTLSFLDYYSPSFAYFENVPGFLRFSLNAVQANQHKVVGGLEMGGLKFLIRALLDMKYVHSVLPFRVYLILELQLPSPVWFTSSCPLWDTTTTGPIFSHCGEGRSNFA
jgi:hypothetical protein